MTPGRCTGSLRHSQTDTTHPRGWQTADLSVGCKWDGAERGLNLTVKCISTTQHLPGDLIRLAFHDQKAKLFRVSSDAAFLRLAYKMPLYHINTYVCLMLSSRVSLRNYIWLCLCDRSLLSPSFIFRMNQHSTVGRDVLMRTDSSVHHHACGQLN